MHQYRGEKSNRTVSMLFLIQIHLILNAEGLVNPWIIIFLSNWIFVFPRKNMFGLKVVLGHLQAYLINFMFQYYVFWLFPSSESNYWKWIKAMIPLKFPCCNAIRLLFLSLFWCTFNWLSSNVLGLKYI